MGDAVAMNVGDATPDIAQNIPRIWVSSRCQGCAVGLSTLHMHLLWSMQLHSLRFTPFSTDLLSFQACQIIHHLCYLIQKGMAPHVDVTLLSLMCCSQTGSQLSPIQPTRMCVDQTCSHLACMAQIPQVLDAIQLSQATFNKIRQNLWWAFGYNLVGIPLAAGALLPSMGVALTPSISGASLLLLGSSLQHGPLSVDDT